MQKYLETRVTTYTLKDKYYKSVTETVYLEQSIE